MLQIFKNFVKSTKSLWFHFTHKGRKNRTDYIPVDVQIEIAYFEKNLRHNPKRAFIMTDHAWSKAFRLWMFQNGMFELFGQISSDEEIKELLAQKANLSIAKKVLSDNTPSRKLLEELDYSAPYIKELVKAVPLAFQNAPTYKVIEQKDVLEVLVDTFLDKKWFDYLNSYMLKIVNSKKQDYEDIILKIADRSINGKEIAKVIPTLRIDYPNVYVWVRDNIERLTSPTDVMLAAFVPKDLPSDINIDIDNISDIKTKGTMDKHSDALAWLRLLIENIKSKEVFNTLVSSLDDIKRMNETLFEQLCEKLAGYHYAGKDFLAKATPKAKMIVLRKKADTTDLWSYYPFTSWPEDLQKEALDILVKRSGISYYNAARLPENLRYYVFERAEVYAQISTIFNGNHDDLNSLYSKKLSKEVEEVIVKATADNFRGDMGMSFDMKLGYAQKARKYIEEHHIDPSVFRKYLLKLSEDQVRDLIVKRKSFSRAEYSELMASRFKFLAHLVKVED